MNHQTVAVLVQEGGKFLTQILALYPPRRAMPAKPPLPEPGISREIPEEPPAEAPQLAESKDTGIEAGCVPCALGHFSTCSGLLDESMRFVRSDGLDSTEVIDRIAACLKELNAMEREDLPPHKIHNLPPFEKRLAIRALDGSRATRHALEAISSVDSLEKTAANTTEIYQGISREWFQRQLAGAK
jgi:hypothetical protein